MPHFLLVFDIVGGLKGDLIICLNVLTLPFRDHVNVIAALNYYSMLQGVIK